MKKARIFSHQSKVLEVLSGRINDFYLAGGTALSLFYFQHRVSFDLDFFTSHFSLKSINKTVKYLQQKLKLNIKLSGQSLGAGKAKILIYHIYFNKHSVLKIDFAEDMISLIKEPRVVEGIKVLSLEDIYLRKIYALIGLLPAMDEIGRKKLIGGRAEPKDFYDLYFLSHTFMGLSGFIDLYGGASIKEGLIGWFRTYDRMSMIDGVLRMHTDKKIAYRDIEKHFKEQIDAIIESMIGR